MPLNRAFQAFNKFFYKIIKKPKDYLTESDILSVTEINRANGIA